MEQGFVQVYIGLGKGKSTAATGLIVRALGQGFKVLLVRFLKACGARKGELIFLKGTKNLEIIFSEIGILSGRAKAEEAGKVWNWFSTGAMSSKRSLKKRIW